MLKIINDGLQLITGRRLTKVNNKKDKVAVAGIEEAYLYFDDVLSLRNRLSHTESTDLAQFQRYVALNFADSTSQLFQDLWVLWELRDKRNGYFVEFGAYDGLELSNTYPLEKFNGWKGLLAEPNIDRHSQISASRTATLDKRCVFRESGQYVDFSISNQSEFSTISQFETGDSHHLTRAGAQRRRIETVSLDDLLLQNEAPQIIDYMSIDTEGSELEILSSFSWKTHIRLITVEHNYTVQQLPIDSLLQSKGYVKRLPSVSRWDGWYIHSDDYLPHE